VTLLFAVSGCLLVLSGRRKPLIVAVVVGVAAVFGVLAAVGLAGFGAMAVAWRRARTKAAQARQNAFATSLAIDVVALSVSAGLPFSAAADLAARTAGGDVATAITSALRTAHGRPLSMSAGHEALRAMFDAAHRSAHTGASLGPMLVALGSALRDDRAAKARERLSRLPVKLLFPLSFLILPGFVLLAVAPAVVGGLSRLGI
jgi:tight adherence protein C